MEDLIKILRENRHLRNEDEVAEFDSALAELPEQTDDNIAYLTKLFDIFVDDCDQPEVMWGLLHFVEDFDDETYISAFLSSADKLSAKAGEWLEIILARILNNDDTKKHLLEGLQKNSNGKNEIIIKLLEKLKTDEDQELGNSANEVLRELK